MSFSVLVSMETNCTLEQNSEFISLGEQHGEGNISESTGCCKTQICEPAMTNGQVQ